MIIDNTVLNSLLFCLKESYINHILISDSSSIDSAITIYRTIRNICETENISHDKISKCLWYDNDVMSAIRSIDNGYRPEKYNSAIEMSKEDFSVIIDCLFYALKQGVEKDIIVAGRSLSKSKNIGKLYCKFESLCDNVQGFDTDKTAAGSVWYSYTLINIGSQYLKYED